MIFITEQHHLLPGHMQLETALLQCLELIYQQLLTLARQDEGQRVTTSGESPALSRLARTGAMGTPPAPEAAKGEAEIFARLADSAPKGRAWAETAAHVSARNQQGTAVNLDPAALVMDMLTELAHLPPAQSALPAKG